jgi:hypothetical protein
MNKTYLGVGILILVIVGGLCFLMVDEPVAEPVPAEPVENATSTPTVATTTEDIELDLSKEIKISSTRSDNEITANLVALGYTRDKVKVYTSYLYHGGLRYRDSVLKVEFMAPVSGDDFPIAETCKMGLKTVKTISCGTQVYFDDVELVLLGDAQEVGRLTLLESIDIAHYLKQDKQKAEHLGRDMENYPTTKLLKREKVSLGDVEGLRAMIEYTYPPHLNLDSETETVLYVPYDKKYVLIFRGELIREDSTLFHSTFRFIETTGDSQI